ncbi:MAG: DEAD/DEAH box helicase family protein [bacterium]|nr:DEAD/DEAH box helicase family protein [bacterium]
MSASSAESLPPNPAQQMSDSENLDPRTNPVINTPYEEPRRHWELDAHGRAIEGQPPKKGRRPSHGILPVPTPHKGKPVQAVLELNPDDLNETVEEIRVHLRGWRRRRWEGATDQTRRLLAYWTRENRHIRPFFAQLEAVETVIWLTETRQGRQYAKNRVAPRSEEMNEDMVRWAIKMATGTGKTMVMAMLIVWHTLNDIRRSSTSRRGPSPYTSAFLAITPGHTVRERLGELAPSHPGNVYDRMDLVPPNLRARLNRAQVAVVNFQAFQRRDLLSGVSGDGRKVLDPLGESGVEDAAVMLDRVLRSLKGRDRLLVLNDEAHHCYNPSLASTTRADQKVAGVWFNAIRDLQNQNRLLAIYDFSATPMFISTAAKKHGGELFPWVVSDFPLLEAIESGLVKIPRLPVDDDAESFDVKWRAIYANAKPKKVTREELPGLLEDSLHSLYFDWVLEWKRWRDAGRRTPPVLIVVANSIFNARALYDYIGGYERTDESGRTEYVVGALAELSNVRLSSAGWKETPVTLLMHSKLDSDDKITGALAKLVKAQATRLSAARRGVGATDDISLLRNVLNTVGRVGEPGEHIRCVISVSMLTEGWDTRTVTHVLGYRAFSTQLLCEQVTGRALRRTDYESVDSYGRLTPEYSQVLGIPFDFMPTGRRGHVPPPNPPYTVRTVADRADLRIELPRLAGYAWQPGANRIRLDPAKVQPYEASVLDRPTLVELGGVTGETELVGIDDVRFQQAAWRLAAACVRRVIATGNGQTSTGKGQLFADLRQAVSDWLQHPDVHCPDPRVVLQRPHLEEVVGHVLDACSGDMQGPVLVGMFDSDGPTTLDTSAIDFETTLADRYPPDDDPVHRASERSELNIAACHSGLEATIAKMLDADSNDVEAWVRNFRLGWDIPYLEDGVWRSYEPDFVARIRNRDGDPVHLIVECKGRPDEESETKARYVTEWWIPAVANSPQIPAHLRSWRFVEITDAAVGYHLISDEIKRIVRSGSTTNPTTESN